MNKNRRIGRTLQVADAIVANMSDDGIIDHHTVTVVATGRSDRSVKRIIRDMDVGEIISPITRRRVFCEVSANDFYDLAQQSGEITQLN